MNRSTETVRADQLVVGDIVTKLPRDHCEFPLTVGRAEIDLVDLRGTGTDDDGEYVWLAWNYSSQRCTTACYDEPFSCPHFGNAGGGSGRLTREQLVDRFIRGDRG